MSQPYPLLAYIATFTATLLTSYLITQQYRHFALKQGVVDTPNRRSSHSTPTPRGGGISVVITSLALVLLGYWTNTLNTGTALALLTGGGAVALIGFLDDLYSLPNKLRFATHLLASLAALLLLDQLPTLPLPGTELQLAGFWLLPLALALTWLINLYNFMDGIDGIAATEALCTLMGASLIYCLLPTPDRSTNIALTSLMLMAPLLGFLLLNWPPARIFMGDGCSGFLGFFLGLLGIIYSNHSAINLWSWAILLGVFVVDSGWTLITRMVTGQTWHQAHRSHCYQILSRKIGSHLPVTLGTGLITLFWLTPMAWLASANPHLGIAFLLIAYSPLALLCLRCHAGLVND